MTPTTTLIKRLAFTFAVLAFAVLVALVVLPAGFGKQCGMANYMGCLLRAAAPVNTDDWSNYENTAFGYSFKYPADWTLSEQSGYGGNFQSKKLEVISPKNPRMHDILGPTLFGLFISPVSTDTLGYMNIRNVEDAKEVLRTQGKGLRADFYRTSTDTGFDSFILYNILGNRDLAVGFLILDADQVLQFSYGGGYVDRLSSDDIAAMLGIMSSFSLIN